MQHAELPTNWDEFIDSMRSLFDLPPAQSKVFGLYFCKKYMFDFLYKTKPKVFQKIRADNQVSSSVDECTVSLSGISLEVDLNTHRFEGNFKNMLKKICKYDATICSPELKLKPKDRAEKVFEWLRNTKYSEWNRRRLVHPYPDNRVGKAAELNRLLLTLNYSKQDSSFKSFIEDFNGVGTVLVRAKDDLIQRWLVYRLFQYTPDIDRATQLLMKVPEICYQDNDYCLWAETARKLNLPHIAEEIELQGNANDECIQFIQNEIIRRVKTKPFVMVLFDVRHIQFERLMECFWTPLIAQVKESDYPCLLILCDEADFEPPQPQKDSQPEPFISLTPLEKLEKKHVRIWIKTSPVKACLCNGAEEKRLLEWCAEKNLTSKLILSLICRSFELNNLAELEQSWEVTL